MQARDLLSRQIAICKVLKQPTAAGRGGSRARGRYMGHVGQKRPRNQERLSNTTGGQSAVIDTSMEHEYSD